MTADLLGVLEKIKHSEIFKNEPLYFAGGTALSFHLQHRISEDLDFITARPLNYKAVYQSMLPLSAEKVRDEKAHLLKIAGLNPDEYFIKLRLDNVKMEFFRATRSSQLAILESASYSELKGTDIKMLDVASVAKLKLVALLNRSKSRDLFDFAEILKNRILSEDEIIKITQKEKGIDTVESLFSFIDGKTKEPDDEPVYLSEEEREDLSFAKIKEHALSILKNAPDREAEDRDKL